MAATFVHSVFTEFEGGELNKLVTQLTLLERRLEKAKLGLSIEL